MYDAKFSLPWSVAAMVLDGEIGLATYTDQALSRPEVLDLAQRVEVRVKHFPGVAADAPGRVVVRLADGRTVDGSVPHSSGGPDHLLDHEAFMAKLAGNVGSLDAARSLDSGRRGTVRGARSPGAPVMPDLTLPSILPVDPDGEVVHPGDFVAQYAWCLDLADQLLRAEGLSLDNAVTTYDFSTPATRDVYRRTHRERKARLGKGGVFPGAGGILVDSVDEGADHPGALVRLEVTASPEKLVGVNPGWERYETLTYYPGVLAGRTLYMSGFAALDMETQEALHEDDLLAQARVTYAAIVGVISEAGGRPEHLTSLVEYVCPDAQGQEHLLDQALVEVFGNDAPMPERHPCAGLLRDEFLFEVFPTAVIP